MASTPTNDGKVPFAVLVHDGAAAFSVEDEYGYIPERATEHSAGYDLRTPIDFKIEPGRRLLVKLGLGISTAPGTYARFAPRSGMAFKNGIMVLAGVIDGDYREDCGLILYNSDHEKTFEAKRGDRVGQVIFERYYDGPVALTAHGGSTRQTIRQALPPVVSSRVGGFGSTGV